MFVDLSLMGFASGFPLYTLLINFVLQLVQLILLCRLFCTLKSYKKNTISKQLKALLIIIAVKFVLVIYFSFLSNIDRYKKITTMVQSVGMVFYGIWIYYVWNYVRIVENDHVQNLPSM